MTAPGRGPSRRTLLTAAALGTAGLATAGVVGATRGSGGDAAPGEQLPATVATRWAEHYLALVRTSGLPAPVVAEMVAELGVVLYATLARPAARPLSELGEGALRELDVPVPPRDTDPAAVVGAAFAALLPRRYLDSTGPALQSAVAEGEAAVAAAPAATRSRSQEAGRAVASAVHGWYLRSMLPGQLRPVPRASAVGPGSWRPTPPDYDQPALPYWGSSRTLVLPSVHAAPVKPPPEFSTRPDSERYALAVQVVETVEQLRPHQEAQAKHWADGKWTITPPGHWLRIATAELERDGADAATSARALLRLGLSQHDAFVSCWWCKYHFDVLRPLTYVREVLGQRDWLSPVPTPCFPEYPSGHSTQSAAAARALGREIGERSFTDATVPSRPARSFASFEAASRDAAASRLYGGIHFANANDEGLRQGRIVGEAVAALDLRG